MIDLMSRMGARVVRLVLPTATAAAACAPNEHCRQQQRADGTWRHRTCWTTPQCGYACGSWSNGRC